ncbi:M12 family metallopeptidase [Asticcacaulis solisilvae]|uniref:M12 family metallopeptidase n=1 Tax=Asticcacaulis solisilvae TaxID=1217274 RepID=UPI003FD8CB75
MKRSLLILILLPGVAQAAAVADWTRPWPKGEVPYRFAPEFLKAAGAKGKDCTGSEHWTPGAAATLACRAMVEWTEKTGVRFFAADRLDSVDFIPGTGSDGTIGHWPIGNHIHIEKHATYGAVLHELGHVLGLMHEQQRPDRDTYIQLSPFLRDDMKHCTAGFNVCIDVATNFPTVKTQMQSDYDPCSLMHYLADQTPRHREDPRWSRIYTLTTGGQAAFARCRVRLNSLPSRCDKPGQKCTITADDAMIVRRFELGK